jgi:hypothetical protein
LALILAVNPGGSQNAALERLARELRGHELVGADSCAVAISAVDNRVPDLILLPALPEAERGRLLARLAAVPGGVRTLQLPQLASDDVNIYDDLRVFADQIREQLAGPPTVARREAEILPVDEHRAAVIAAAVAAASWIRARRATWSTAGAGGMDEPVVAAPRAASVTVESLREPPPSRRPEPVSAARSIDAREIDAHRIETEPVQRIEAEPFETVAAEEATPAEEPAGPSWGSNIAAAMRARLEPALGWLPRLVVLAGLVALAVAGVTYWPKMRAALTRGTAVFESGPAGSQVFVDGRLAGTTPVTVELPAGRHTVEFRNGADSRTTEVVIVARGHLAQRVDWATQPTGGLQVDSDPTGARVLVDGKIRGATPLMVDGLSLGTHGVVIESAAGTVRQQVTIEANQTAQVTVSIFSGSLAVFAPFDVEITEGNQEVRLDDRGRAAMAPGTHTLRFRNRTLGYNEVKAVEIAPGETTTLNLLPQTTISVTSTEPAEVSIDGASAGNTPLVNRRINLGTRIVTVKTADGTERRFTVTASAKPVQLNVDFSKPQ